MKNRFEFKISFLKIISTECECGYEIDYIYGLPYENDFEYFASTIVKNQLLSNDKTLKPMYAFLVRNISHDLKNNPITFKYSIYITDKKYENRHFYLNSFLSKDEKELLVAYLKNACDFMNAISLYKTETEKDWHGKEIVVF